jgi:D-arabinan exo alpha-(1,3)/(1,5)-arabinofuranosidase (non-reducing end)
MRTLVSGTVFLLVSAGASLAVESPGVAQLYRLDRLPRFRDSVFAGSVSSYDRTGGNDDGFSGTYSFVRKEADALVLADLEGPGVVYRIWTPTPTDDPVELYFDGETTPRIELPFRDLFTGRREPFVEPLVGSAAGGNYSYVPLAYERSLKIRIRAEKVQFYQINYATFAAGTALSSWTPSDYELHRDDFDRARELWGAAGEDVHGFTTPPGATVTTSRASKTLAPGTTSTLFEIEEPGRIVGLRLGPASAFAGKDRAIVLRIYWDGEPTPAVEAPVSDFFGYSFGVPAARSILLGTSGETSYVYFPMPFDRSARVELASDAAAGAAVDVHAELSFAPVPRSADEGKFYAIWHRENPTTPGVPFTFVRTRGRGQIVATLLQAQGTEPGNTNFFEGDDEATLDGVSAVHGTGSEDFFNGGWYDVPGRWEARTSLPVSGCLDYKKHLGRTGAYRLFLTDAYPYRESVDLTIEHGPTGNDVAGDYTSVTFLYSEKPPVGVQSLPPVEARRVVDFDRVVFTPGWNVSIYASSLQNATLTKKVEEIGGERVRMLSLQASGEDIFGPHHVAFLLEAPAAGRYRVLVEAMKGPAQGTIRLYQNERPLGAAVDFYSAERAKSDAVELGQADLAEGENVLFFRVVGKNPSSSGIAMDLVTIVLERRASASR